MDREKTRALERIGAKHRERFDDDGHWITIRGTHVYVGGDGQLTGNIGRKIAKSQAAKKASGKDVSGGSWKKSGIKPKAKWEKETLIPRNGTSAGGRKSSANPFHEVTHGRNTKGGREERTPGLTHGKYVLTNQQERFGPEVPGVLYHPGEKEKFIIRNPEQKAPKEKPSSHAPDWSGMQFSGHGTGTSMEEQLYRIRKKEQESRAGEKGKKKPRAKKNAYEKATGKKWQPMTGEQMKLLETGDMLAHKDGGYVRVVMHHGEAYYEAGKHHLAPITDDNKSEFMWTGWNKPQSPWI